VLQRSGVVNSRINSDFFAMVERARKALDILEKEFCDTIQVYLKQAIQLKNRELLRRAMDDSGKLERTEMLDKELMCKANDMLQILDAQHHIQFYLQQATKSKDLDLLEESLTKARGLSMGMDIKDVADATKLFNDLKAQKARRDKSKVQAAAKAAPKTNKNAFELFGGKLSEAVKRSDREVPKVCYLCIEYLESKGLREPGLFRVPGNQDFMVVLQRQISDDQMVKLEDVHDTAGVLKQYLRKLPEPLIPYDHYANFVRAGAQFKTSDPNRLEAFRGMMHTLPRENLALLKYLCRFLLNVSRHAEFNKMSSDNLAIVFAPNLLRPAVETPKSMMTEMPVTISVIASFIDKYTEIFEDPSPAPNSPPTSDATGSTTPPA